MKFWHRQTNLYWKTILAVVTSGRLACLFTRNGMWALPGVMVIFLVQAAVTKIAQRRWLKNKRFSFNCKIKHGQTRCPVRARILAYGEPSSGCALSCLRDIVSLVGTSHIAEGSALKPKAHFQILSQWELGFKIWILGNHKHPVHGICYLGFGSQRSMNLWGGECEWSGPFCVCEFTSEGNKSRRKCWEKNVCVWITWEAYREHMLLDLVCRYSEGGAQEPCFLCTSAKPRAAALRYMLRISFHTAWFRWV